MDNKIEMNIYLTKKVKQCYNKNFNSLTKETKRHQEIKTYHAHGFVELILPVMIILPNSLADSMYISQNHHFTLHTSTKEYFKKTEILPQGHNIFKEQIILE